MIVFDELDAADAGTHGDADPVAVSLRDLQPGMRDGIETGRNPVVDEGVRLADILGRQVSRRVEILDLPGDLGRVATDIEVRYDSDAGLAVEHISPGLVQPVTDRRDYAHAGYDDASVLQDGSVICGRAAEIVGETNGARPAGRALDTSRRSSERLQSRWPAGPW